MANIDEQLDEKYYNIDSSMREKSQDFNWLLGR